MPVTLHDPATYAHGFPYTAFAAAPRRGTGLASRPSGMGTRLLGGDAACRRPARLPRLDRVPERTASVPTRVRRDGRRRDIAAHDQPRSTGAHEAPEDHQQRLHAPPHQRSRRPREGQSRRRDRLGRRPRRVRSREGHRPLAAVARHRRPGRSTRRRSQAGVRVDRAHLRLRSEGSARRRGSTPRPRCSRMPTRCVPSVAHTHATTS